MLINDIYSYVAKQLKGENGEDEDVEMGEPSNSKEVKAENGLSEKEEIADEDLQNRPTKSILIDIKTECDINEENNDTPVIDLAISL